MKTNFAAKRMDSGNVMLENVECFRAGVYPQGTWTPEQVAQVARNWNKDWYQSPVTLDHETEGSALGKVAAVRAEGDSLYCDFELSEWGYWGYVASGAYTERSVELCREVPLNKENTARGPYLRAVTLLGAGEPAVKGMRPIDAAFAETFGAETAAEKYILQQEADVPNTAPPASTPAAETPENYAARIAALEQDNKAKDEAAKAAAAEAAAAFALVKKLSDERQVDRYSSLIKDRRAAGVAIPKDLEKALDNAFNAALGSPEKVTFSATDYNPVATIFAIIDALPVVVPQSLDGRVAPTAASGSKPARSSDEEFNQKVIAYAAEHKLSYAEAFNKVVEEASHAN